MARGWERGEARCKPGTRREPWHCWWLPPRVTAAPDGWLLATEPCLLQTWAPAGFVWGCESQAGAKGHQMVIAMRLL